MVAEMSTRDCIRVWQFLQFLRILVWAFPVIRQWGKGLSCNSCQAFVMHLDNLALPYCTPLVYHLRRVNILALYSQQFRLQATNSWPHFTVADRQKDRKTDRRQTDARLEIQWIRFCADFSCQRYTNIAHNFMSTWPHAMGGSWLTTALLDCSFNA